MHDILGHGCSDPVRFPFVWIVARRPLDWLADRCLLSGGEAGHRDRGQGGLAPLQIQRHSRRRTLAASLGPVLSLGLLGLLLLPLARFGFLGQQRFHRFPSAVESQCRRQRLAQLAVLSR